MLRICQLLIFFIFITLQLAAQRFLVSNDSENILYLRVPNPVSAVAEGIDCNHLVITIDNGSITKQSDGKSSCKYISIPTVPGTAKISIYKKTNGRLKKIDEMFFRVKMLPEPDPMVGNIEKDTINKKVLIALGGVRAIQVNSSICYDFEVISYNITIIRKDSLSATATNIGARYNHELLEHLNNIQRDDQIIISDITVRYYDRKPMLLEKKLKYKIIE